MRARRALEKAQTPEHPGPEVDDGWVAVSGGPKGSVAVRLVRPADRCPPSCTSTAGAGSSGARTHDRLVRELAVGVRAVVVFPEYTRSPEARYPQALEECYAVAEVSTASTQNDWPWQATRRAATSLRL